jgi:hypothetical protein
MRRSGATLSSPRKREALANAAAERLMARVRSVGARAKR